MPSSLQRATSRPPTHPVHVVQSPRVPLTLPPAFDAPSSLFLPRSSSTTSLSAASAEWSRPVSSSSAFSTTSPSTAPATSIHMSPPSADATSNRFGRQLFQSPHSTKPAWGSSSAINTSIFTSDLSITGTGLLGHIESDNSHGYQNSNANYKSASTTNYYDGNRGRTIRYVWASGKKRSA